MSRSKLTEWKQFLQNSWREQPHYTEKDYPDVAGKTFLITGAVSGVGFAATKILLEQKARVVLIGRSKEKAKDALQELSEQFPETKFEFVAADLSDLESVSKAGQELAKKFPSLDGAILNAGIMIPPYSLTKQGHELQWGTNVVGHHLLAEYISPALINAAKTASPGTVRIVWVSSSGNVFSPYDGGIKFDDISHKEVKNPSAIVLYSQSKIGNAYQAYLWSKHHPDSGVISVSLDPGNLSSNLVRHAGSLAERLKDWVLYPAKYGAYTELSALLNPEIKDNEHLVPWGRPGPLRADVEEGRRGDYGDKLWDILEQDVKPYYK